MTQKTTIRAIGNSAGATIPKSWLERFHLQPGDAIYLIETDQGILLTPFDPDFEEAMKIYQEGARVFRNALHELAR
jgi:putative addiction module antidote